MAVWIALVALILIYVGIWWAISHIRTTPRPLNPPLHLHMQSPDRLRMDLHTDDDEMTI